MTQLRRQRVHPITYVGHAYLLVWGIRCLSRHPVTIEGHLISLVRNSGCPRTQKESPIAQKNASYLWRPVKR